jgi:hypothetical protein
VHSTSFRTLSKFVEKKLSSVALFAFEYGQIDVGQSKKTIVADQVHTSLGSNVPVAIIILPRCIGKQAIISDGTNNVIVLDA